MSIKTQSKPIVVVNDTSKKVEGTNLYDLCIFSGDAPINRLGLLNDTSNITPTTTFADIMDTQDMTIISQILSYKYLPDAQSLSISFGYDVTA